MSLIGAGTGSLIGALYMFVFGVGLGLVMQVLVVAVQNSVTFEDLGVATSGATFFRMIGGSFGAAIFGAVYTNVLASKMAPIIAHSTPDGGRASFNFQSQDPATFALLAHKLPVLYHEVINAIAGSVDTVFFFAAPVALLAFALSWFLPEMELRKTVRSADLGESFAMPQDRTSLDEIRLILEHMISAESRVEIYRTLAKDAGFELSPRASWLLYRFLDHPDSTLSEIAARLKVSPSELEASLTELENASMIERTSESDATEKLGDDNDAKHTKQRSEEQGVIESLTPKGQIAIDLLLKARQDGMTKLLERWEPEQHPDVIKMIKELSESTLGDDEMIFAKVGRNDKD